MAVYRGKTSAYDEEEKKKAESAARNAQAQRNAQKSSSSSTSSRTSTNSSAASSTSSTGSNYGNTYGTPYGTWNGRPAYTAYGQAMHPVLGGDGRYYYSDPVNHYDSYDSGADAALLSQESQDLIQKYKDDWTAAQKAGDQEAMDRAHAAAEAVRALAGYSGGANGGAYNLLWYDSGTGASSGGGQNIGYEEAPSYASKYQGQIDALIQELINSQGGQFTYADAPTYTSRYQDQIDALGQQILGRGSFSYDPETDPTYQQYRESYTKSGQRAMQDTLGQVSARTGGMASSYAGSAAQQTYDNYMSALADKIPELRQIAYQMYMDDLNGKRNDLAMLQGMEQSAYNQYLTMLGQYNTDRNFDYGTYRDQVTDQWRGLNALIGLDQTDYNRYRDQVGDQRYDDETSYNRGVYADQTAWDRATYTDQTAYNRGVYEDETAYNRGLERAQQLAAVGDFSGYQELGYSEEEVQRMQAAFFLQHPELAVLNQTAGGTGLNMGSYVGADSMGNTIYYTQRR